MNDRYRGSSVVMHAGASTCSKTPSAFCAPMPRYKRPRKIIFDRIPRNPTGKIEKPVLREKYCRGRLVETQITG
jgi:acyl-CoA synthetase (AMP-forming)/AMP-acid ligase II